MIVVTKHYTNLVELIDESLNAYADKPAYTCLGHTLSFRQIDRLSAQFASYLQKHTNLKPGDRIAIQLPNIFQYPVVMYGALRAGLVIVNTNPLYTDREIQHQFIDSGAKALVVLSNVAAEAAQVISKTNVETIIVTDIADLHPFPQRLAINFVLRYIKKAVPQFYFPNSISLRKALSLGEDQYQPVIAEKDSLAVLQYTGGTTGVAKGAMLSHDNLASNAYQIITHLPSIFTDKDCYVTALPLYHIYAFNLHALATLSCGGHNILIPNPRDIKALIKAIRPHPFSIVVGINTLFSALCNDKDFRSLDFSHLKCTASGGMALTEDAAHQWEEITGCAVCEGYGLTETSPVVCGNLVDDIRLGTIGLPVPGTELKVVNDEGKSLPNGEAGELCVRGPQVMQGYWKRPEETEAVFLEGAWLKTGDIAVIDDEGFVKIVDRKKDMIIVSGFNVYPNEVEDVICKHPKVLEAAVIGLPCESSGECVKAYIVSKDEPFDEQELKEFCRENLTAYKVPKHFEFREGLPKTNVGKILRRELRTEALTAD